MVGMCWHGKPKKEVRKEWTVRAKGGTQYHAAQAGGIRTECHRICDSWLVVVRYELPAHPLKVLEEIDWRAKVRDKRIEAGVTCKKCLVKFTPDAA